jgi:hypothetical protein
VRGICTPGPNDLKGSPPLRRTALATVAASLVLAPAASAQLPVPPTPTPPTTPQLQPANITVGVAGLREGRRTYAVARTRVQVLGHMNPAAAGDTVTIDLFRRSRRVKRAHAKVNKKGNFAAKVRTRNAGAYTVRALHRKGAKVDSGKSKRAAFTAVNGRYHVGSHGPVVRLIQRQLKRLAYVTPRSGHYDGTTAHAVLAYRKVNHMSRITSTNRTLVQRLFEGRGSFRLRYPKAGKHVEADLTRQVLVLANHGRPERIYHMSSGKPSTPTVVGKFRFYRKGPGYNAEGMYFSNYFIRGYAIHGYHDVPTFAASHGCLRVPLGNALSIYKWISLGDPIFVYQKGKGSTRVRNNAGP